MGVDIAVWVLLKVRVSTAYNSSLYEYIRHSNRVISPSAVTGLRAGQPSSFDFQHRQADQSSPFNAEVMNAWSNTSISANGFRSGA